MPEVHDKFMTPPTKSSTIRDHQRPIYDRSIPIVFSDVDTVRTGLVLNLGRQAESWPAGVDAVRSQT